MTDGESEEERDSFYLVDGFQAATTTGGLQLGPLEMQYQELFSEVLEDGVITPDERARLQRAADNLGLDRDRLARLEEAMTAAYETHHRTRVVDHSARPHFSLSPLKDAAPLSQDPRLIQLEQDNTRLLARIAELEADLERAQAAINVEVDLRALDVEVSAVQSPDEAWKSVRHDPTNIEALRGLRDAYDAVGDQDGRFLALQGLYVLGATQPDEAAFVETQRSTQLIAPRRAIDEALFRNSIMHPDEEATTGAIFSIVAPAILVGRVTTLRRDHQLHLPAPETRQDPAQSTVMAVRALAWAGALLGLPVPRAYTEPHRSGAYIHTAAIPPYTVLGADALRGKTATQLAFLVGQHMTGYRGEHFVRTLFSSTEDLEDLFLAALLVANHRLPVGGAKGARIIPLARAIEPLLEAAGHDRLKSAYLTFAEEGGRTNLQRWSQATKKTAARAGLALCQDLLLARDLLEPTEGRNNALFLDLLSYSTSPKFRNLRQQLGISLNSSHA